MIPLTLNLCMQNKLIKSVKKKLLKLLEERKTFTLRKGIVIALILFALIAGVSTIESSVDIKQKQAELDELQKKCDVQRAENDALEDLLNNGSDEYIEQRAREQLDMVLPGERVYIVRAGN